MHTRRTTLKTIAASGLWAAFPAALSAEQTSGHLLDCAGITAPHLPDQRISIWLPPGYDTSAKRYRVLYMHDAQNLFDPALSNFNKVWAADKAMLGHAVSTGEDPWIIVGIWSPGADRYRQYMPEPAYSAASPELREKMDAFGNGDPIVSKQYIDWIAGILKTRIDRHFRTLTSARDTAIIGSSMGGLISLYAFLDHPNTFGRAGCVSTHWPGTAPQEVGEVDQEMLGIWQSFIDKRLGQAGNRRLWFDHGDATLDAFYPPYQAAIDAQMEATDWQRRTNWESRFYPGAEHEENAWAARLPEVLNWVLS
ncbi:alpha/beta fold hydrolase [uncultured Erythrobacter sp.]|uniref:alpha/beta hydrolase n=1 Tax=uncultured Erythrobacter sp. TaxID=263913 RepID=UPI0026034A9F|nr:alpha/beta fold hydrolase [uncultured Erythrobacter sp.]